MPAGFHKFWRTLEINIKMDLKKTWESMDWIAVVQERDRWLAGWLGEGQVAGWLGEGRWLAGSCEQDNEPMGCINCGEFS
jgi:hypothetical protein